MSARKRIGRGGTGGGGKPPGARGSRLEPGAADTRRPRAGQRFRVNHLTLVTIAVLAAATLWSQRARLFPAAPPVAPGAPGPAAPEPGLTLQQEAGVATRLVNSKQSMPSLPYYRHLLAAVPSDLHVRFNYVTALSNAALESRDRPANAAPWARSSIERVELLREALAQLDLLARQVQSAHERAMVHELRARLYKNWGFNWDTVTELRAAQALDPGWRQVQLNADFFEWLIHHPEANLDSIP